MGTYSALQPLHGSSLLGMASSCNVAPSGWILLDLWVLTVRFPVSRSLGGFLPYHLAGDSIDRRRFPSASANSWFPASTLGSCQTFGPSAPRGCGLVY
ncbi:hypothetical protein GQ457_14G015840 [Hibiscus cannabinus]